MNRQFLLVFVAICLLSQNAMALRGALFRSGRSLLHRQNLEQEAGQPHLIPSDKRSPVVELYPVVENGNVDPEAAFRDYFRL
ncbi:hypothetical protein CAEBREN_23488 [Caenorhabditis brenneri]|uniref:Uncharacterized protein n=1 Tax=Caenorhabditis brenneri TaxID=135651 RepID=G0MX67_CAEBE|nr:hypothetical protein CAEBREN_23488 [Caenorhabditis brenneri]